MKKPDTAWFKAKFEEQDHSIRSFATLMKNSRGNPMDFSSLFKILTGEKILAASEAYQLSVLLGVSVDEILYRAGIAPKPKR